MHCRRMAVVVMIPISVTKLLPDRAGKMRYSEASGPLRVLLVAKQRHCFAVQLTRLRSFFVETIGVNGGSRSVELSQCIFRSQRITTISGREEAEKTWVHGPIWLDARPNGIVGR